jgi:hypothetical protein
LVIQSSFVHCSLLTHLWDALPTVYEY